MYKIIKERPTKEEISMLKMMVVQEDDYVDYVIDLNMLSKGEKEKLCELYSIDCSEVDEKDKLYLTVSSSI